MCKWHSTFRAKISHKFPPDYRHIIVIRVIVVSSICGLLCLLLPTILSHLNPSQSCSCTRKWYCIIQMFLKAILKVISKLWKSSAFFWTASPIVISCKLSCHYIDSFQNASELHIHRISANGCQLLYILLTCILNLM